MAKSNREAIYTSQSDRDPGHREWRLMLIDVWKSREIVSRLVYRDISVRYRHSFLGYFWAFFPPLIAVGALSLVYSRKVIPVGATALPYALHAVWSLSLWQLFSQILGSATGSLVIADTLVRKISFPKETVIIASAGQPLFDFLLRLIPISLAFVWFGVAPAWQVIFLPLLMVPVVLLALGLAFPLAIINMVARDVGSIVVLVLALGTFATPIFYPQPETWPATLVNILNPFSPLLIATQDLIGYGALRSPLSFWFMSIVSFLLFLAGWRVFRIGIRRVTERG